MNSSYYKHCIVPGCKSTSIKTPEKLFIHVPYGKKVRKQWLKLVRKDDADCLSTKSRMYFCEDHFDLPNDMENYMQYHLMGSVAQVRMKPGCVPSRFECQNDTKTNKRKASGPTHAKSKKKRARERQNDMVEIEIDIGDGSSGSSDAIKNKKVNKSLYIPLVMMPNDKAIQNLRYTKIIKDTTFICNRYIYGNRCEAEIQVEIATKKIPKNSTNNIQLPKIKCEDKSTETENKYFVISTTDYKPLRSEETEISKIESKPEMENEELGETSRLDNESVSESEEFTEISSIKIEVESDNEEFTKTSRMDSESETGNEGFSNASSINEITRLESEPVRVNEKSTEISSIKIKVESDNEEFTETSRMDSESQSGNEAFSNTSSIKSEPYTNKELTKTVIENKTTIENEQFTKPTIDNQKFTKPTIDNEQVTKTTIDNEQCTKTTIDNEQFTKTTFESGTETNNDLIVEITSIKSEPIDEAS